MLFGHLFKNGWTDWDAFWVVGSDGRKEMCIRWGPDDPMGRGNFVERGTRLQLETYAVSCAKRAEPFDSPFGLWTLVGWPKHNLVVRAVWSSDVCVCWYGNFWTNDLWSRYSARWFILTQSRSRSWVRVHGQGRVRMHVTVGPLANDIKEKRSVPLLVMCEINGCNWYTLFHCAVRYL